MKSENMRRKKFCANGDLKRPGVAILISDKVDFKS